MWTECELFYLHLNFLTFFCLFLSWPWPCLFPQNITFIPKFCLKTIDHSSVIIVPLINKNECFAKYPSYLTVSKENFQEFLNFLCATDNRTYVDGVDWLFTEWLVNANRLFMGCEVKKFVFLFQFVVFFLLWCLEFSLCHHVGSVIWLSMTTLLTPVLNMSLLRTHGL